MNKTTAALFVAASASIWVAPVRADVTSCCGNLVRRTGSSMILNWCLQSYSPGDVWTQRISDAAEEWNDLGESSATFFIGSDSNCLLNNNENEIWYTAGSHEDNALQVTFRTFTGGGSCDDPPCCNGCTAPVLGEADIVVFGVADGYAINWLSGVPNGKNNDPIGTDTWFLPAMQHEMGHVMGLEHSVSGMYRMNSSPPCGGWFYDQADPVRPFGRDRKDAKSLYNAAVSYSDLYMANTQTDVSTGQSKPLSYDPLTDTPKVFPRNKTPIPGYPANLVHPGQTVEIRYCRGNLGDLYTPSTTITVYLSTDRVWSATDANVGSFTQSAIPGRTALCSTRDVLIPLSTPTNAGGIGYYILYGNITTADNIAVQDRGVLVIP